MAALSAARQAAEMDRATAEQWSLSRIVSCAFRPLYRNYNSATLRLAQQRRMGVWLWSADTQDLMAEDGALRHPIVLMHNQPAGNRATVSALPAIIQFFRSRGYRFVTLLAQWRPTGTESQVHLTVLADRDHIIPAAASPCASRPTQTAPLSS